MFGAPGIAYIGYRLWRHPGWTMRPFVEKAAGRLVLLLFCLSWLVPFALFVYGVVVLLLQ